MNWREGALASLYSDDGNPFVRDLATPIATIEEDRFL